MKIKFAKLDENAIIPTKRKEDAGFDIYTNINDVVIIEPNETIMLKTGIASVIDDGYCVILKERGSTGTKGIGQRSGVIDSGYRGEWIVPITNHNPIPILLYRNEDSRKSFESLFEDGNFIKYPATKAICQAIVLPVICCDTEEITYEELQQYKSERGTGKLGSSGK